MILDTPEKDLVIQQENISDEEMIQILAEKVQAYLDVNISLLMSYLYRLDVKEQLIREALSNTKEEPGNYQLARLIWDRQKQRIETKKRLSQNVHIEEDWAW